MPKKGYNHPGKPENLMPGSKDKNCPRYKAMREGAARYHAEQKLKKENAATAKRNLESLLSKLALEDLNEAIATGEVSSETVNISLKMAKTIEEIEEIPVKDRTKDHHELWKYCYSQLRAVTGQEASKKTETVGEQTINHYDKSSEELKDKIRQFQNKVGKPELVVDNDKSKSS